MGLDSQIAEGMKRLPIVRACQRVKALADRIQAEATRLASDPDWELARAKTFALEHAAQELRELLP